MPRRRTKFNSDWYCWGTLRKFLAVLSLRMQAFRRLQKAVNDRHAPQMPVVGQFDCGRMTGLNGSAGGAYLENVRFVCAIDPRRIRLVAGLRQGFDAPDNASRTQRPIDPTRVHTGIVGRTSTNERWQAEDCGRQMTDKHPKRPRDNTTPPPKKPR